MSTPWKGENRATRAKIATMKVEMTILRKVKAKAVKSKLLQGSP